MGTICVTRFLAARNFAILGAMVVHTNYDPASTMREARAQYFSDNRFGADGGYSARWVTVVAVGPLRLGFPNTAGRVRAVRFHDLHHLATGYATDFLGEAEIAAWELASGCEHMRAAWVLNTLVLPLGWRHPSRIRAAFARGSRSMNLYHEVFDDGLLDETLKSVRDRLRVDRTSLAPLTPPEMARLREFLLMGVLGQLAVLAVTLAALAVVGLWLRFWLGL